MRVVWLTVLLALASCQESAEDVLLLPQWQLDAGSGRVDVTLPTHLDDLLEHRPTAYELTATVPVPPGMRGRALTFALPYLASAASLTVDGELVTEEASGIIDGYRTAGTHVWRLPAAETRSSELRFALTVRNSYLHSAWIEAAPRLATGAYLDVRTRLTRFFNETLSAFTLGALAAICFATLVLFMRDRRQRSYGWLCLATFLGNYYVLFQLGLTQGLGVQFEVPVLSITVVWVFIAILHMAYASLGASPSRGWMVAGVLNTILALAVRDPYVAPLLLGRLTVGFILVAVGQAIRRLIAGSRATPPVHGALGNLISLIVFMIPMTTDAGRFTGLGDPFGGIHPTSIGVWLFTVTQFVILVRTHLRTLQLSDQRQGEILVLNEELRRQVAERSLKLTEALARLAAGSEARRLQPGELIDDRFRVVRELGAGGMGRAYEVVRTSDGARLAIKVLTTVSDARIMARFAREAQIASQLVHPCLIRIMDLTFATDGFMFLVMELVDGQSLDRHRSQFGVVEWALPLLEDIAEGMAAIHQGNVVHRDLKPANILVTEEGHAKIADFGVSAWAPEGRTNGQTSPDLLVGSSPSAQPSMVDLTHTMRIGPSTPAPQSLDVNLTLAQDIVGTPAYMAPELVLAGRTATPASDMFAFGLIAFDVLTGVRAFARAPAMALLRGEPRPDRVHVDWSRHVAASLGALVESCLDYDPLARPTAAQMLAEIRRHTKRRFRLAHG